jgi:hypothetical protein
MLVLLAAAGAVWAQEGEAATEDAAASLTEAEVALDLGTDVQPMVDCSDRRPDDDCLSGRLGADQVTQACNGIGPLFGAGNCSTHCQVGYYACGK